ncbi:MAG TPA: M13 family metallopeptidase [Fermentimonas caenicola]|jgi:putative endopeptidase|uniref:M13 family metallopeptidase n=1 Tax=Lascolabacillus sp. TaxID=1924068 RepID=UPI0017961CEF|nr:M13 family metallopeptidase [Lascolabacillus sp.]MBP6175263.1 M13 family metallopeptidase [Fermentimonas sp.]MDI9625143.1 M13 family metallopeptidase [Bacteroidota bacterium]HHU42182.1 M13 family metallopeptidase [Fermentimonas caenicola]MBP6196681.1 M13 family metallopeptidase [Fermentimonas sp.]MBP7105170.1 M13 family metallopeptidase [Fermentimonas sp.]
MKRLLFPITVFFIMTTIGCTEQGKTGMTQGLNISDMDTTVSPGESFYQYATGGWQKANPIPDEYARYGSFDKLREENQHQIQALIQELSGQDYENGTNAQKVGDLYSIGMDSVKLNSDGAEPIRPLLQKIADVVSKEDIIRVSAQLSKVVSNPFFGFSVGPDDKNSSMNIVHIYQSGIGMGDRDYYLLQNEHSQNLRAAYIKLMETQFQNTGYSEADAKKAAANVMKIETELAGAHVTKEMRRLPELNYHKLLVSELDNQVAPFAWNIYFDELGAAGIDSLNVSQIEPVKAAIAIIEREPIEVLKDYLSWKVINSAANYLSDDFVNANFEFYGRTMSGSKELRPRWRRTIDAVNGAMGEAVGQLYVEKYFPAEAKERMLNLVENLKISLGERISQLEWMSDATKEKAQEKLGTFIVKIGYPDKWKDYSSLEIKDDSYWQNIMRASEFAWEEMMDELGKPVDRTKWYMSPQTVNAYYSPSSNEICFPAGILQPPFFYMDGDDAINYGGIGVVIGHEMTHGFDDQGRKFDKDGNLTDWWTAEDAARFDERAKVLVDFFDNIVVLDTVHANGTFTLGENIADHGGLQVAYHAFQKTDQAKKDENIDGFTPAQRFFLSYAGLWAGNVRDAEILRLTQIDPHSLGKWRVDGALPHIEAWYEAFGIDSEDPMYVPAEERASIW